MCTQVLRQRTSQCYFECHNTNRLELKIDCFNDDDFPQGEVGTNGDRSSLKFINLDVMKSFIKPENMPSNPECSRFNVSAEVCDDFTKYRILLCGGDQWKQVACIEGNCDRRAWPDNRNCEYATNGMAVLLCSAEVNCRLMCKKNEGKYPTYCNGKSDRRVKNTDRAKKSVLKRMGLNNTDWQGIDAP